MAFQITAGRDRQCKDTNGGVKNIYIAPYVKALRSEIVYDGVSLTQFPQTFIYKFELVSTDVFQQSGTENEGGKFYNQTIELTFNKISAFDNLQFQKMLKKDFYLVLEDKNGNFFLMGFRNGVVAEKLDTGTNQQYRISFTGQEIEQAPFCEDLINTDFIVVDFLNKIFQDESNFIFQNDENYIFM